MATITLNGQQVEVPDGINLIQAAETAGVTIPHYCYHPGLPVDGNCRMCLVEVEGARGPQISCNTPVKDGMVVKTDTPAVEKMRKGVQEFLLLNHPIDCPICDQAGECRLQDYYMEYGQYQNRSMVPKVEKDKVVDLGPLVVLDQERCILCSRCVRFCESVTKTGELVISNRGDRSRIQAFPGKELDNAYSGNVVDLCPVGALTSKDFRFKQRVWFLDTAKSVCTGCSNGCAVTVDFREGQPYRYKPRHNPLVNDYWMCDSGRLSYKQLNENRLYTAILGGSDTTIGKALDALIARIRDVMSSHGPEAIAFVGSAHATLETQFVLRKLAKDVVKTSKLSGATLTSDWEGDDFLKKADRSPNRNGLRFLDIDHDPASLRSWLESGQVQLLVLVDNELVLDGGSEWAALVAQVPTVALFTRTRSEWAENVAFALPIANHVEQFGSFVQAKGVLQKLGKAYDPEGDAVPALDVLQAIARALGSDFGHDDIEGVWSELLKVYPEAFPGIESFYGIPEHGVALELAAVAGK